MQCVKQHTERCVHDSNTMHMKGTTLKLLNYVRAVNLPSTNNEHMTAIVCPIACETLHGDDCNSMQMQGST